MKTSKSGNPRRFLALLLLPALLSGCATMNPDGSVNVDPYEKANRAIFNFNDALDRKVMRPIAEGYRFITPAVVRDKVTNFFNNIRYPNVILNSFLQGKPKNGVHDTMRFIVNSVFGIGGLFDMATPVGLDAHKEDFGQTLATWGVGQGAYLNIPFFGPNTARNLLNFGTSYGTHPLTYSFTYSVSSLYLLPVTALEFINLRANLLDTSDFLNEAALDPYSFVREAYLQQREFLIHDGNPPGESQDDLFDSGLEDDFLLDVE